MGDRRGVRVPTTHPAGNKVLVGQLVAQLGSESWAKRDAAQQRLIGEPPEDKDTVCSMAQRTKLRRPAGLLAHSRAVSAANPPNRTPHTGSPGQGRWRCSILPGLAITPAGVLFHWNRFRGFAGRLTARLCANGPTGLRFLQSPTLVQSAGCMSVRLGPQKTYCTTLRRQAGPLARSDASLVCPQPPTAPRNQRGGLTRNPPRGRPLRFTSVCSSGCSSPPGRSRPSCRHR